MGVSTLTSTIRRFALEEAGFDQIGITSADLDPKHAKSIQDWIQNGYAGTMDYMVRDGSKRANPHEILPDAKSVLSLVVNYYHPEDPKPEFKRVGKVAKYAYGRDYHKTIQKMLKRLSGFIEKTGGPGTQVKSYVDTGPILEKAFAQEAGLGFFGKNTNIITREFGSFIFLASLVTNLELEIDQPHLGSCGSCRICIDACPTEALLGNYEIDARKCISYLTIESKNPIPEKLKPKIGEWVFGCDICQDVCPYNFRAKTTKHTELYLQKKAGTWLDLDEVAQLTPEAYTERFQGSPLMRSKQLRPQ